MQTKEKKPYAVGFNGHAVCCGCESCISKREKAFRKWARSNPNFTDVPLPEGNQTVYVRCFWRRPPNYRRLLLRRVA